MENQHRNIDGYRELRQQEIDLINEVKEAGAKLEALIEKARATVIMNDADNKREAGEHMRWVAIAKTHLQQGIMALVRVVAKPNGF